MKYYSCDVSLLLYETYNLREDLRDIFNRLEDKGLRTAAHNAVCALDVALNKLTAAQNFIDTLNKAEDDH